MLIGCRINACSRGSWVFLPGPAVVVFPGDRIGYPAQMAGSGCQEGGNQEAFGSGF